MMQNATVRRVTGTFGVAGFFLFLAGLPLYFLGPQPSSQLQDSAQFSESVSRASNFILARATLVDPLIMACLLIFLAGFRQQIQSARPQYEWLATLVFGAGVAVLVLELAGDALQGGAALDTVASADPAAVKGLMVGSFVLYGAIGLIMSALLLASAGYAILVSRALPAGIGWAACAAAAINLVAAPSIFGGTDLTSFYTASGYVTFMAQGALLVWFFLASVSMLVKRGVDKPDVSPS